MFDFTGRMEALVEDLVRRLPAFAHVRTDRLLVTVSHARRGGLAGTYARIYPLRFEGGASRTTRRTRRALETYEMPPLVHEGREILYIITFLLPRFQNLTFEAKLATVAHELYHVGLDCDGDIRRLPGRKFAHGRSREAYDRRMAALAAEYLSLGGHTAQTAFLRPRWATLVRRFGGVTGRRVAPPLPRLVATEPLPTMRGGPARARASADPSERRPERPWPPTVRPPLPPPGQLVLPFLSSPAATDLTPGASQPPRPARRRAGT